MADRNSTIESFLHSTAAKQPTPGGGAVAALAGALSAAIGEMVLNYSVGRKSLAAHADAHARIIDHLTRSRSLLLDLMEEDQAAYEAMTALRKAAAPADALAAATLTCIRVPQAIAATGASVLSQALAAATISNPYLLSDLAVCAELAMATVRCGVHNVRANLPALTDPADRQRFNDWCAHILADSTGTVSAVIIAIHQAQTAPPKSP